ncbi:MAG: type II secretion system protein [Verrucomicrobiales bacterium]
MRSNLPATRKESGFTRTELVVVIATVGIISAFLLPLIVKSTRPAAKIKCVNHLKNIGLAFRIYATDNRGAYPTQYFTNWTHSSSNLPRFWQTLSIELSTPNLLRCTSDEDREPAQSFATLQLHNISYFVNLDADETKPNNLLAGDRSLARPPMKDGLMTINTNTPGIAWNGKIHGYHGNVAIGDGSVAQLSSSTLRENIQMGAGMQRLLFPE